MDKKIFKDIKTNLDNQKVEKEKENVQEKDLNKSKDQNFCFCNKKCDDYNNDFNNKFESNKTDHQQKIKESISEKDKSPCSFYEKKDKEIENENISKNNKEKEINFEDDIIMKLKQSNSILEEKFSKLQKEMIDNKIQYQADLENFQKRIKKEKEISIKYASLDLIREILVPLEQLTKVLENSKNKEEEDSLLKRFLLGFQMINQQIHDVLKKEGVQEIEAIGKTFDPKFHFSIGKISDKNIPNNTIVDVLQKGFIYKDLGREMMPNY